MWKTVGSLGLGAIGVSALIGGCSAAPPPEASDAVRAQRQAEVDSINGLKSINGLDSKNGLNSKNGLKSTNGLASRNGLKSVNGLSSTNGLNSVNGLASKNGLKSANGLPVDCTGPNGTILQPGVTCDGNADGMLSNVTGLLSKCTATTCATPDDNVMVAKYLVRCALPKNQSLTLVDYTGNPITLPGEIGLTPYWFDGNSAVQGVTSTGASVAPGTFPDGYLDADGMEIISACLEAFTNGEGNHVQIELDSSKWSQLGTHTSKVPAADGGTMTNPYKYQEAAFWGNMFVSPPTTAYCTGKDYAGILSVLFLNVSLVTARACSGYSDCPYANQGNCESLLLGLPIGNGACNWENSFTDVTTCGGSTWKNPVYTYRLDVADQ